MKGSTMMVGEPTTLVFILNSYIKDNKYYMLGCKDVELNVKVFYGKGANHNLSLNFENPSSPAGSKLEQNVSFPHFCFISFSLL